MRRGGGEVPSLQQGPSLQSSQEGQVHPEALEDPQSPPGLSALSDPEDREKDRERERERERDETREARVGYPNLTRLHHKGVLHFCGLKHADRKSTRLNSSH